MATLDQLRGLFPNASSDADVIKQAAADFGISPAEIASEVGYSQPKGGITSNQFGASIDRYQAGLYGVGEEVTKRAGLPTVGRALQGRREENELQADLSAQRARDLGAVDQWKDVHGVGDFGSYAKGLAIQSVPYAAEALVGGLAGRAIGGTARAALAGGTAASYPSSVGDILGNQREQNGQTNLGTAAALGVPYAALNALGETGALAKGVLPKNPLNILDSVSGFKGGAARAGASLVKTGAEEAVGETGQEVINQLGRMSVDSRATLTDPEALERYKESAIGGFALGGLMGGATGWRRSSATGGDVGAAIAQEGSTLPQIPPQAAAPMPAPAPTMPSAPMTAPAVSGGSTDIAVAQQQAQQENQQQQVAQQQQVTREKALQDFGVVTDATAKQGQFLGKPVFGPMIAQVGDAIAPLDQAMEPHQRTITQAVITANAETGGKLISFSFNANNPQASVQKGFEAVAKAANKFQIAHVQSTDEAAQILDAQSQTAKKNELDQINAIHQALTGKDTSGYIAEQQAKASKEGAKNGKLQLQQQTNAGVREVPVASGATETVAGGNGPVRPTEVQPVGAASVGAGSLGLQVGQPPASGVRTSPTTNVVVNDGSIAAPNPQVIEAQNEQATQGNDGGRVSSQPEQTDIAPVGEQAVRAGPRIYAEPPSYYATDLSHIKGERRIEIIKQLFVAALQPKQARKNTVPAETRAELVRLALMEQLPHKTIAELTGVKVDTVEKQLERMGIALVKAPNGEEQFEVTDPQLAKDIVAVGEHFRSPEFPDGIGEAEMAALYTTRYEGEEATAPTLAEEIQAGEQEGKPQAKLAEELHGRENGTAKSMGTIVSAGGSQGAVEATDDAFFAKVGKLQAMLDITPETDEAGRANLAKQIEALWAQYAKKQATRAETGEVEVAQTEEEDNAIQEPSPTEVPVRKRAGGGKAVGKGNAKGGKAAAQSEAEVQPQQEEVKTPAEQWGELAAQYPAMPTYETLSKDELVRWDDLAHRGVANLAAANKILSEAPTGAITAVADEERFEREMRAAATKEPTNEDDVKTTALRFVPFETALDIARRAVAEGVPLNWVQFHSRLDLANDGAVRLVAAIKQEQDSTLASKSAPSQFMEFDDLDAHIGGMDLVREQFEEAGIPHAVDLVADWEIIDDDSADAAHGSLRTVQGRYVGTLNIAKLDDAGYAAETARHEIAHAIDMGPHGGIYSAQPEMGVSVVNGKITAEGPVAKELFGLYSSDTKWKDFLAYPFDSKKHPELNNRTKVQLELFAQAFSIYTTPQGRAIMEKYAPVTAAYFKEVVQDVKSTKPVQIQKVESAALRAAVLYTRRESKGNRGPSPVLGLDERIDELLASRSSKFQEGLDNTLPASVAKPAKAVVTNLATAAKNGLLAAGITEDIVSIAGKYMRSAQDYLTAQYARQKTRLDFEQKIEYILDAFDKLPKALQGEGAGSVNRFILDSTMSKKWGFYPGEHRVGTTLLDVDPDLAARFKAFPADAQQVIRDVFEHGYTALKAKKDAIDTAVEREFAKRTEAAAGDADLMDEVAQAKKLMRTQLSRIQNVDFTSPYAYLGRYGDYVVAAKSAEFKYWEGVAAEKGENKERAAGWLAEHVSDPEHYVVQFADTQGEADQIASDLMATGKFDMDGTEAGPKEDVGSYTGSDVHLAVARLRNLIARQEGESGEGSDELNRMVSDLYLMTAAENSARKSEIMRKYVAGANGNMMRNLATSGRADAHFLSTMKHNDEVVDSLERMRTEAKNNVRDAMPLYNELYKRQTNSLEYKTPSPLSRALTQATSVWFLSTSPAFYLQQLLQTTVLSLPYMSGRLGYFRSVRAIKSAYSDVADLVKGLGVNAHIDFSKAPADVRGMLQTLVGMGKIDIGIDADAKARAGEHNVLNTVMRKLQGVNNRIEAVNRATAAIAAYRGYIQRYGAGSTDAATKFAAEVVSNTHGSYDGFNTPRILNSDTGRLVGQFKRFQIIQLSMLGKLINSSFKGASPEERVVARRSLAFITGHMAVLGGALGVPFVQQVGSLLLKAFGDDDEPKDLEYKLRQAIGDETMANLLLNGIPAAAGVNLGGKLGMGNVASILPFTDVDLSTRSGYEKMAVGLMGPFLGGLAPKMIDGAGMLAKGEYYKGLELLMPNGIGNAMKGVRFANEGVTMRNGDVVLKPEEISIADAAFQAVGLPTTTITGRQYTQKVTAEFDQFYSTKATEIKGAYVNASRSGDTAAMADARKEWEDLQTSRRNNGYKIQPISELFKATMAARKREAGVVDGVETSKSNKQFVKNII